MPTATQVLLREHEQIHAVVKPALQAAEDLSRRGAAAFPGHRAALLALADLLVGDLSRHSSKEEEIFFPVIERLLGTTEGPTSVMRTEHSEIHAAGGRFRGLMADDGRPETGTVDPERARALAKELRNFGELVDVHFQKEEMILFPLAESRLPMEQQLALGARLEGYPA